jgi:group I intron endonuclease
VLSLKPARQLPGVYLIRCKKNNKCYFGESQNVSTRLSQHKSLLRKNRHGLEDLRQDFQLYGEENFEFGALFYFERGCSKETRVKLEMEYVTKFKELCYNKHDKTSRSFENNPFWNKQHTQQTREQISASNPRRGVKI